MPISPDTKNWTWILDRPCAECGFDADAFARTDVPRLIRENAEAWTRVLARPGVDARPDESIWSPLEYGCHVRDVYRVITSRLDLMLAERDPTFANWDQDETAVDDAYAEQDPARVSDEMVGAAASCADRFAGISSEQWSRPGMRSDGSRFTVESLARYCLHDVVHHLADVPSLDSPV